MSDTRDVSGYLCGKFARKKKVAAKLALSENMKAKWEARKEENAARAVIAKDAGAITSTKRRIVEMSQIAIDLWCSSCQVPLSLRQFISEKQHGLAFIMNVRCWKCGLIREVKTARPSSNRKNTFDMNYKLTNGGLYCTLYVNNFIFASGQVVPNIFMFPGMYDSGSGVSPVNTFLSALNIPQVSGALMKRHERYVGPAFLEVAKEYCTKNLELEKQRTEASLSM